MSKIKSDKLLISSDFYSVQGEGISTGIPSYFIRLGLCNLNCGMSRKFTNELFKSKSLEDGEIFKGDLELEGKASWTCDSTSQWLWRGEDKDFQYLIDQWKEQGIYNDILTGDIHLIWTGGEPLLHQIPIYNFFKYWSVIEFANHVNIPLYNGESIKYRKINGYNIFNEIETNGTIYIEDKIWKCLDQINCSPKLSNSGMSEKQRINPDAIKRIMEHKNYQFKFVISDENDIKEMIAFRNRFLIPMKNIVCMPGMDSQDQFHERTQFVMEMAKKYKFRGMSRMHISAWDKTLNV